MKIGLIDFNRSAVVHMQGEAGEAVATPPQSCLNAADATRRED